MSPLRRAARVMARHAAAVLPADCAEWGRAMQAEIDHIERDTHAFGWATGCIWASYLERGGASLTGLRTARGVIAALIAAYVLIRLPAALKSWSIMSGHYFETAPGGYAAATPAVLMTNYLSPWFLVVFLVHSALYLSSAAMLALGWRRAPDAFVLALAVQMAGWLALRTDPFISRALAGAETRQDIISFTALAATAALMAVLTRLTRTARERRRAAQSRS